MAGFVIALAHLAPRPVFQSVLIGGTEPGGFSGPKGRTGLSQGCELPIQIAGSRGASKVSLEARASPAEGEINCLQCGC